MDPTVPIPVRAVRYAGYSLVRNNYALAVRDGYAFDMKVSDDIDVEQVGIGIVTGAPDAGILGTGNPESFPVVHVVMARIPQQETDIEVMGMLRVIQPFEVRNGIERLVQEKIAAGEERDSMIVIMNPHLFRVMAAHGLYQVALAEEKEYGDDPDMSIDDVEWMKIADVEVRSGVTDPGYWFHLMRKLE